MLVHRREAIVHLTDPLAPIRRVAPTTVSRRERRMIMKAQPPPCGRLNTILATVLLVGIAFAACHVALVRPKPVLDDILFDESVAIDDVWSQLLQEGRTAVNQSLTADNNLQAATTTTTLVIIDATQGVSLSKESLRFITRDAKATSSESNATIIDTTLDVIVASNDISQIYLLKVLDPLAPDAFFDDSSLTIKEHKVDFILLKYWPRRMAGGDCASSLLLNNLMDAGYRLHHLEVNSDPVDSNILTRRFVKKSRPIYDVMENCKWYLNLELLTASTNYTYWTHIVAVSPSIKLQRTATTRVGKLLTSKHRARRKRNK